MFLRGEGGDEFGSFGERAFVVGVIGGLASGALRVSYGRTYSEDGCVESDLGECFYPYVYVFLGLRGGLDVPFPLGVFFADLSVVLDVECFGGFNDPVDGVAVAVDVVWDEVMVGGDEVSYEVCDGGVVFDCVLDEINDSTVSGSFQCEVFYAADVVGWCGGEGDNMEDSVLVDNKFVPQDDVEAFFG